VLQVLCSDAAAVKSAIIAAFTADAMAANVLNAPKAAIERMLPWLQEHAVKSMMPSIKHAAATGEMHWLLHLALYGQYPMARDARRPAFLQKDVFAAAKEHGCGAERVRFHTGAVQDVGPQLAQAEGKFDLIDVSNIFSFDLTTAKSITAQLKTCLAPGGAILCRKQVDVPGLAEEVFAANGLTVSAHLNARLSAKEQTFTMKEGVCAAFNR
jgi:Protein of unknown function (DUF3419)